MFRRNNPSQAAFGFILITAVLDTLAFGLLVPVLPKLVLTLEGGDTTQAATLLGLFGTAWALMQFFASPVLGALSDRFGRRPVLLLSLAGLGLDYILMAVAPNVAWLFLGRLVSGVTSAGFPTAMAYVSDTTPPDARAKRFGQIGAAWSFGFIIGPALGGLLAGVDLRAPFWVAAGLCLLNAAYGFFILPESLPREKRSSFKWRNANVFGALALLHSTHILLGIALAMLFLRIGDNVNQAIVVLYVEQRYAWTNLQTGLMVATYGACSLLAQAFLVDPAVKILGHRGTFVLGLLSGVVAWTIYAFASEGWMYLLGIPFAGALGIAVPAMQSIAANAVDEQQHGKLQGALATIGAFGSIIAPILFTQVFNIGNALAGVPNSIGLPYMLAAALLVVALIIGWRAAKPQALKP